MNLLFFLAAILSSVFAGSLSIVYDAPPFNQIDHNLTWFIEKNAITFSYTKTVKIGPNDLTSSVNRWTAFSLNQDEFKMKNSDFIVIVTPFDKKDKCIVSDRFASGAFVPSIDSDIGGTNDIDVLNVLRVENENSVEISCVFRRALDTGDKYDVPITNTDLYVGFATGDTTMSEDGYELQKHKGGNRENRINFFTGSVRNPVEKSILMDKTYWHGVLMVVSFLLLMFPFSFVARYLKFVYPMWFFYHRAFQFLAVGLLLLSAILIVIETGFEKISRSLDSSDQILQSHVAIGIVLLVLLVAQVVLGYLSNALWYEGKAPHFYPDKMHWWTGRTILVLGAVNCVFGVMVYCSNYLDIDYTKSYIFSGIIALITVLVVFHLLFEAFVGQKHEHEQVLRDDETPAGPESEKLLNNNVEEQEVANDPIPTRRTGIWSITTVKVMSWLYFLLSFGAVLGIAIAMAVNN